MRHANPTRGRFAFKRDRLPNPADYYREQGLKLPAAASGNPPSARFTTTPAQACACASIPVPSAA